MPHHGGAPLTGAPVTLPSSPAPVVIPVSTVVPSEPPVLPPAGGPAKAPSFALVLTGAPSQSPALDPVDAPVSAPAVLTDALSQKFPVATPDSPPPVSTSSGAPLWHGFGATSNLD